MNIESSNGKTNRHNLEKYNVNVRTAFFTIMLSIFVDVLGYSMILPLLPSIAKIFGAEDIIVGILISSNAITALIFGPIWGRLSDVYGRKPILVISQLGTFAAFIILGFSNSIFIIFISRIVDGIFGGQIPVIRAIIADITTPQTRSSEIGKITVSFSLGMVLGPSIGGLLGAINWRYPAFLACVISIISIILTLKVLIESMPPERRVDLRKQISSSLEAGIRKSIWNKALLLRLFQLFLAFSFTTMFNSSLALVMDKRYGVDTSMIGFVMTLGALLIMIYGGFLLKRLIRKFSEKNILLFAFLVATILGFLYPYLYELWMVFIFIFPFTFCMAVLNPLILSNITKSVEADRQGLASGWSTNVQSLAQSSIPIVSTGFLQIGSLNLGFISLNQYELIGFTTAFITIILIIIALIDLKLHPDLYEYEEN